MRLRQAKKNKKKAEVQSRDIPDMFGKKNTQCDAIVTDQVLEI